MEEAEGKQCCTCKKVKPLQAFQNDRTTRDGKKPQCKACTTRRKNFSQQPYGEKKCYICQTVKDYSFFGTDASSRDGYADECKDCTHRRMRQYRPTLTEATRARQKHYHQQEPVKRGRAWHARARRSKSWGTELTPDAFAAMYNEQNGACAIGGMRETGNSVALAIDHDHTTGAICGLLCCRCNPGLGQFMDNPDLLRKAAIHLEK